MNYLLGVGHQAATINERVDPRLGFDTPEPLYDVDRCTPTAGVSLAAHDRVRLHTAAVLAEKLWPGAVGKLIAHEIESYVELGQALGRDGLVARAVDDILKTPVTTT